MIKPRIFREGSYGQEDILEFINSSNPKVVDIYKQQRAELVEILNPQSAGGESLALAEENPGIDGDWIYFPWSNLMLHTVNEQQNTALRTNRNRNIITQEEQAILRSFPIAIAGLSVGGNIATTLCYNGFPTSLKLADFDKLETTNLNRIRGKLSDVGRQKVDIVCEQLYELDPYLDIQEFPTGIDSENVNSFLSNEPIPKLIFEIIDDLKLKVQLRLEAKRLGIPLIMLSSIGDSVLIDIERYDTEPNTEPFNGLVDQDDLRNILSGNLAKTEENKYVVKIVGMENVPEIVMKSIFEIGKSLVGRPQLMSTITIEAGIAAYLARLIALGHSVPSGRSRVAFEEMING